MQRFCFAAQFSVLLPFVLINGLCSAGKVSTTGEYYYNDHDDPVPHANKIFNSIQSAVKQWGNTLHHNGMSFFIATVMQGTEMYHGTSTPYRVNGIEWLAFEPEHAMAFARPARGRQHSDGTLEDSQRPFGPLADMETESFGWYHTYRAKRDLRYLYVDGQSAAKSIKGTLDTQDVVLRNTSIEFDNGEHKAPINWDYDIANDLCNMAKHQWADKIDGILRMVGGFEVIDCNFAKNLDVVEIHRVDPRNDRGGNDYSHALSRTYDGVGGDRIFIDFEMGFISMFQYPEAIYFDKDGLPRVRNDSAVLKSVRTDVDRLMLSDVGSPRRGHVNWQAIADLIVSRYSNIIEYLMELDVDTEMDLFRREISASLKPFVDDRGRDFVHELERCTEQLLPSTYDTVHVSAGAVAAVAKRICSSFLYAEANQDDATVYKTIQDLQLWLDWPEFRRRACRACNVRETFLLPIWPSGSTEDLEHPQCSSQGRGHNEGGYWDIGGRKRESKGLR